MLVQGLQTLMLLTTKIVHFLPCLKQDALFYDIGSFCFAYRIRFFFQTEIMELIFLVKNTWHHK